MYYYLYEIRNNINGKIYIGVHKTKVLDDGYMGSGKILKASINKYGSENFVKTILEYFDTSEEMFAKEKEIVNEEFLVREDTYNLRRGGMGGFDYINSIENHKNHSQDHIAMMNSVRQPLYPNGTFYGKTHSEETKAKLSEIRTLNPTEGFTGKTHTEEHKLYMSAIMAIKSLGESNSQYGTMWITNGILNKKINKNEIIPENWYKGRYLPAK